METPRFSLRLNDADRADLERIAKHHDRNTADMIRVLIRAEARRLAGQPQAQPSAPPADEPDDFTIIDD